MLWPRLDRGALRVWERNRIAWMKIAPSSLLISLGEPALGLLALGYGLGSFVGEIGGVRFPLYIAPGLMVATAMMGVSYDLAYNGFARLRRDRVYDSMVSGPLQAVQIAGGELLWGMTRSCFYGGVFLLIIALFGLVRSWTALFVLPILFLQGWIFAAAALGAATLAKMEEQLFFYFTLLITPMFMFSGIFFPVDTLPPAAAAAVQFSPLYHSVVLARALSLGEASTALWPHLLWLVGFAILLAPLPATRLHKELYD